MDPSMMFGQMLGQLGAILNQQASFVQRERQVQAELMAERRNAKLRQENLDLERQQFEFQKQKWQEEVAIKEKEATAKAQREQRLGKTSEAVVRLTEARTKNLEQGLGSALKQIKEVSSAERMKAEAALKNVEAEAAAADMPPGLEMFKGLSESALRRERTAISQDPAVSTAVMLASMGRPITDPDMEKKVAQYNKLGEAISFKNKIQTELKNRYTSKLTEAAAKALNAIEALTAAPSAIQGPRPAPTTSMEAQAPGEPSLTTTFSPVAPPRDLTNILQGVQIGTAPPSDLVEGLNDLIDEISATGSNDKILEFQTMATQIRQTLGDDAYNEIIAELKAK